MTETTAPGTDVEVFQDRSTDVEVATGSSIERHLPPARELNQLWKMAGIYARMPGLAKGYAGNQEAVMAALLTAWQLDLPTTPMIVNEFYSWEQDGRTQLYPSSALFVALGAKHNVEVWFSPDSDARKATAYGRRGNGEVRSLTYTFDMAKQRGLTNKKNWVAAPDQMLKYRAARNLLKSTFPDVIFGIPSAVVDGAPIEPVSRAELEAGAREVVADDEPEHDDPERPFTE